MKTSQVEQCATKLLTVHVSCRLQDSKKRLNFKKENIIIFLQSPKLNPQSSKGTEASSLAVSFYTLSNKLLFF